MENLILELNKTEDTNGELIAKKLGNDFNCFGSYSKKMKELNENLTNNGKNKLRSIICIAALELAQWWKVCNFNDWDERKKASELFAYNNLSFFETELEKIIGFKPTRIEKNENLARILDRKEFKECEYLLDFLNYWTSEHSTIKQAIFGGYVNGILLEEANNFNPNNDYGGISFPFI